MEGSIGAKLDAKAAMLAANNSPQELEIMGVVLPDSPLEENMLAAQQHLDTSRRLTREEALQRLSGFGYRHEEIEDMQQLLSDTEGNKNAKYGFYDVFAEGSTYYYLLRETPEGKTLAVGETTLTPRVFERPPVKNNDVVIFHAGFLYGREEDITIHEENELRDRED